MKNNINNKNENYFLLNKSDNYNKTLNVSVYEIIEKYSEIIIEYYNFVIEKIEKQEISKYIFIRGLETITHIFNIILYYTKNLDLTCFYCQKSFYLYIEFISQICEDDKKFLKLTSRDAIIYVYKKTIYEIKNEYKIINDHDEETKLNVILQYIYLYKKIIIKIMETKINNTNSKKYILLFEEIKIQLNNTNISYENMKIIINFIDFFYFNTNTYDFLNIINIIFKKCIKKLNIFDKIERKISNENSKNNCQNMTSNDFVDWIIQN